MTLTQEQVDQIYFDSGVTWAIVQELDEAIGTATIASLMTDDFTLYEHITSLHPNLPPYQALGVEYQNFCRENLLLMEAGASLTYSGEVEYPGVPHFVAHLVNIVNYGFPLPLRDKNQLALVLG